MLEVVKDDSLLYLNKNCPPKKFNKRWVIATALDHKHAIVWICLINSVSAFLDTFNRKGTKTWTLHYKKYGCNLEIFLVS